jgi:hypothetical protein
MNATVYKWERRGQIAELMIKNNFCYFDLMDGSQKTFFRFDIAGATANEAANELNEQLDGISEGVVIVTIQENVKKKTNYQQFYFKVKETPAINGLNPDYIAEKLDAALFRQKIELTQKHEIEKNDLKEQIRDLNERVNSDIITKALNNPFIQNRIEKFATKFGASEPTAAINGVNEDLERIKAHIPEPFFSSMLSHLANALDKDEQGTIAKLQSIFK